jgi:hypothetical protein
MREDEEGVMVKSVLKAMGRRLMHDTREEARARKAEVGTP